MGACCTRQNFAKDTILEYTSDFFSKRDDNNVEEEWNLNLDSNHFNSKNFNDYINQLLIYSEDNFNYKIKKVSFSDIYNIALLYQDNYTNSKYLLYDLRPSNQQKENFLKKMKKINYLHEDIKNMSEDKKNNFKRFLNNHIIIIIFPLEIFEKKNEETKDIIVNLFSLKIDISINLLNTNLEENSLSLITKKLYEFLDDRYYDLLPYILLNYSNISKSKKEGYIFIKFNSSIFSFENLFSDNKEDKKSINNLVNDFIKEFFITTIINIDNEEINKNNFKQFQDKNIIYKECDLSWNEYNNNKVNIQIIGKWIKREIKIGHSVILNIQNHQENKNNYILILLLLLSIGLSVKISQLINYLNEKIIFINGFTQMIEENKTKFIEILKDFEIQCDLET
jgi:hypothetical protein